MRIISFCTVFMWDVEGQKNANGGVRGHFRNLQNASFSNLLSDQKNIHNFFCYSQIYTFFWFRFFSYIPNKSWEFPTKAEARVGKNHIGRFTTVCDVYAWQNRPGFGCLRLAHQILSSLSQCFQSFRIIKYHFQKENLFLIISCSILCMGPIWCQIWTAGVLEISKMVSLVKFDNI